MAGWKSLRATSFKIEGGRERPTSRHRHIVSGRRQLNTNREIDNNIEIWEDQQVQVQVRHGENDIDGASEEEQEVAGAGQGGAGIPHQGRYSVLSRKFKPLINWCLIVMQIHG